MHEHCVNLKKIERTSRPQGSLQILFVITKLTSEPFPSSFSISVNFAILCIQAVVPLPLCQLRCVFFCVTRHNGKTPFVITILNAFNISIIHIIQLFDVMLFRYLYSVFNFVFWAHSAFITPSTYVEGLLLSWPWWCLLSLLDFLFLDCSEKRLL